MSANKEDIGGKIQADSSWRGRQHFNDENENDLSYSGLPLKPFYTSEDVKEIPEPHQPGQYPYTGGIHEGMYRSRLWTRRQYAGFGSSQDSNKWFKDLMAAGQMGLSVALDLPTQMGMDSTNPMGKHEVGRVGVAIDSLADMETLFEGIPLDKVSTSFTINGSAAVILAMYLVTAEKQGVTPDKIRGTVQNDILKEFVARGCYLFPPKPSMRLVGDIVEYCLTKAPKFNPISIAGAHMKSAGATMVQSDAYKFANAIAYCDEIVKRGHSIDDFAHQFSWLSCSNRDFFESICRMRAMRTFWAKIAKERYNSKNPKTQQLRIHMGGDTDAMTFERPIANVGRIALNCLSNVLGGCQSMQLPCYDEAYEIPTEEAIQNALDVQMVVAYESGVTKVADPLAGSYFIEKLTQDILDELDLVVNDIVDTGGAVEWIEDGRLQRKIAEEACLWEARIKNGKEVMVGANYARDETDRSEYESMMHPYSEETYDYQEKSIKNVKETRDSAKTNAALVALKDAADGEVNLMDSLIEAVRQYATIQEITDVLKGSFGSFHAPTGV
ncbi:MAG: methylmalonyl-CoA mutase [Pseudomonadales bacterium]|nr:methylmalonyl-CoA mutase [Pseudomonadales bacterium]